MDLRDATLMLLTESAPWPAVSALAQTAYDQIFDGEQVDYRLLNELVGEVSGKGVLRHLGRKYSQATAEAIVLPICAEAERQAPVPPRRYRTSPAPGSSDDPLTAAVWPIR